MDKDDIPTEWPEARPWLRGKLSDLGTGIRTVDSRVSAQGEAHSFEITSLRQLVQKLHENREKDIQRQGRHHDEVKGWLQDVHGHIESSKSSMSHALTLLGALLCLFGIPFLVWLAMK
jgi:hypothetical protein